MSTTATEIPGYVAGTWTIDPIHSDVSFTVRHMVVSKVRGFFRTFSGTVVTGETPEQSTVTASIDLSSIDTNQEQRNAHIRSADFFDVENFPTMTYQSTGLTQHGDHWILDGELTLKGVTKQVPLHLELNGFNEGRVGFSAKGEINRRDFNVTFSATTEAGAVMVGDKITILLEVEAVLDKPAS